MSNVFKKSCPYNCGFSQDVEAKEGFQLLTCEKCAKPWVVETTYVPFLQSRMVEGFGIQLDTTDLGYIHCADCGNAISPDSQFRLCAEYLDSPDPLPANKTREGHYWPSEKDVLICAQCGMGYEDHGITDGVCPTCFLDEDSVKGLSDEGSTSNVEQQTDNTILQSNNEFQLLSNNTHVSYRCDGDYVDLRYNGQSNVRTSWADIYTLVEELNESNNISSSILQLLDGVKTVKVKAASINAFVQAVQAGIVTEACTEV